MLRGLDVTTLVRYAVPGSVYEILFGGWLYLDRTTCDCYPSIGSIDAGVLLLLAGAAVPLGFIASSLAHELSWTGLLLRSLDDERILKAKSRFARKPERLDPHQNEAPWPIRLLFRLLLIGNDDYDGELAAAEIDVVLSSSYASPARERLRGLIDTMRALGGAFAATVMALLSIVTVLLVKFVSTGHEPDFDNHGRVALSVATLLVSILLMMLLVRGQHKVSRITHYYTWLLLSRPALNADPDGDRD